MNPSEIHQVKVALARRMEINYCSVNIDKPRGFSTQGIAGVTANEL